MRATFGERDTIVSVAESAAVLERVLRDWANIDVTARFFPGTDHVIFRNAMRGMKEMDRSFFQTAVKPYPPIYLETMAEWVAQRTSAATY